MARVAASGQRPWALIARLTRHLVGAGFTALAALAACVAALQMDGSLEVTQDEALKAARHLGALPGLPVKLAYADEGADGGGLRQLTATDASGATVAVRVPTLPLLLRTWERPLTCSRGKVAMQGPHEGRDDRVLEARAENASLGALLRLMSDLPAGWERMDAAARGQWFALVPHEDLGPARVTCRLRDVAVRQDVLPALESTYRAARTAGWGFFLLGPDPAPLVAGAQAAPPLPGTGTFGGWLARGPHAHLAYAAVATLDPADFDAIRQGQPVDVPFCRLSETGRAAFMQCEAELRDMHAQGRHTGPLPQIEWGQPWKVFVRLSMQPGGALQAVCVGVTIDGAITAF